MKFVGVIVQHEFQEYDAGQFSSLVSLEFNCGMVELDHLHAGGVGCGWRLLVGSQPPPHRPHPEKAPKVLSLEIGLLGTIRQLSVSLRLVLS